MTDRLNYAKQALKDLRVHHRTAAYLELDKKVGDKIINLLIESQKYVLPENGNLLYGPRSLPKKVRIHRLPAAAISIESSWNDPKSDNKDVHRRIAIAYEVGPSILKHRLNSKFLLDTNSSCIDEYSPNRIENPIGFVVVSLTRSRIEKSWIPSSSGYFIPFNQGFNLADLIFSITDIRKNALKFRSILGLTNPVEDTPYKAHPVALLPNLYDRVHKNMKPIRRLISINQDLAEEARMVIELCAALNDNLVKITTSNPSSVSRRTANKNSRSFSYGIAEKVIP